MKVVQRNGAVVHLGYCTNVHAGEAWQDMRRALGEALPDLRRMVDTPEFGLGLRLSASAARTLEDQALLDEFREFLASQQAYVFTVNAFPYGRFHGAPVKERVYEPDWSRAERFDYTVRVARLLASLLPPGGDGTISTLPGTFSAWATRQRCEAITHNLIMTAVALSRIEQDTGRTIRLAIEPEPFCLLETTGDAVAFFETGLRAPETTARVGRTLGESGPTVAAAVRRHIGLCYDVCHAAVMFEQPSDSIAALRNAGISILKLQLSSALRVAAMDHAAARRLIQFADDVYLHQVIAKRNGRTERWADLPDALAHWSEGAEWRVHCHVPVFHTGDEVIGTTRDFLSAILEMQANDVISSHLEVETYTFDVLPGEYRTRGLAGTLAEELSWVRSALA